MLKRFFHIVFVISLILQFLLPRSTVHSQAAPAQRYPVTLAGTQVEIDLPFAMPAFVQPAPDDALQVATSARWEPFFEVSLSAGALPNIAASAEAPLSLGTSLANVKSALSSLRADQSPSALPAHTIDFFGQPTVSLSNRVQIFLRPIAEEPVIIHEWVIQDGNLNWTLRVSYTPGQTFDESMLDQIAIRVVGLVPAAKAAPSAQDAAATDLSADNVSVANALPAPAWWTGVCDSTYYSGKSNPKTSPSPLGGSYRGVIACGPRPWTGYTDVAVYYFPGAWGELEWECVELSMRYLYLAYNIPPYHGNGKDVVANYSGTRLVKIANKTAGKAPVAGDVLSYNATGSNGYGHTSVVSASNVDASGNGTITIIEQNNSATGTKTHTVTDWYVSASPTVSGWLHDPYTLILVSPDNNGLVGRNASVDLMWNPYPQAESYQVELTGGPSVDETGTAANSPVIIESGLPGGIYQWRVEAYKAGKSIAISEWRTIYRQYDAPATLSVNQTGATAAALAWGASSDAPGNIDGYHVYRNGALIASLGPTILTYTDSATTTTVCYSVTAYKGTLESVSRPMTSGAPRGSCQAFLPVIAK
jgi:hypothetical protein